MILWDDTLPSSWYADFPNRVTIPAARQSVRCRCHPLEIIEERNRKNNEILASFPTIELVIYTVENPPTTQTDITINSLSLTISTT